MVAASDIQIPYRIIALIHERNRLFTYPLDQMASDIWSARFRWTCCGECCTRAINNHIFLLDHDVAEVKRSIPMRMSLLRTGSSATRTVCCMFRGMHSG